MRGHPPGSGRPSGIGETQTVHAVPVAERALGGEGFGAPENSGMWVARE